MKQRVTYQVSFDLPRGCPPSHATDVLRRHLGAMGGDLRPPASYDENDDGDPMFGVGKSSRMTIRKVTKDKTNG